jgi:ribosomal subunit interface protein
MVECSGSEATMMLRISGKSIDIGETFRSRVEARIASTVKKYFTGSTSGHVTVSRDGPLYRTDCVLHLSSGVTLEATGAAHDVPASFEQSAERIEKRLKRHKERLKDRGAQDGAAEAGETPDAAAAETMPTTVFEAPDEETDASAFHPVVVAETTAPLHRLSVSQAVMKLDLSGVPLLVFRHALTSRVNVVYRRHDGTIGWIDPPASGPSEPNRRN